MIRYYFYILTGILASSNSFALECKSECRGVDYFQRSLVEVCHLDCIERCRTTHIDKNAPQCMKKERLSLRFDTAKANGESSFYILPSEIQTECKLKTLHAEIDRLKDFTKSQIVRLGVNTDSVGMCHALKQYLEIESSTKVIVNTQLEDIDELVKINPCNSSMETCSAVYKSSIVETITVTINDVILYAKAAVPGAEKTRIEEWNPQYCPPYAPDCDL